MTDKAKIPDAEVVEDKKEPETRPQVIEGVLEDDGEEPLRIKFIRASQHTLVVHYEFDADGVLCITISDYLEN